MRAPEDLGHRCGLQLMVLMTVSTANASSYLSTQGHCLKWLSRCLLLAHIEYFWIWINLNWIESDQRAGRPYSPCPVVGICLPASSLQSAVSSSNAFPFLFCPASACTCIVCVLRFGFSFPHTWLLDTWCWDLYRASAWAPWRPGWPP